MEQPQNLEVGGIYFWKRGRNDYERIMLAALPDPNLRPPYNQHVQVRRFKDEDPEDQATGAILRTHKTNLFVQADVDMAAGKKRKTRRRRKTAHKKRKTLSKRK
jgi:hypothetical protein